MGQASIHIAAAVVRMVDCRIRSSEQLFREYNDGTQARGVRPRVPRWVYRVALCLTDAAPVACCARAFAAPSTRGTRLFLLRVY